MIRKLLKVFLITATAFTFSTCQKSEAENINISLSTNSTNVSQNQTLTLMPVSNINSPIRKIDFLNFTYPDVNDYPGFKLKNGKKSYKHGEEDGIELWKTDYTDLNGDEAEDVILFMSVQTGGSAIPAIIYIYTLENKKPKLLWGFMTGDRAEGGLKKIYAEDGDLIIELFGDSKIVNDKWSFSVPPEKDLGAGRPTLYTKNRFEWNGKKFAVQGNPELFDYDENIERKKIQ